MKYLISGGGTGGHIFPAISIANALKELDPNADILFVGALGRMEMERVPQAGYQIVGLPVRGFNRAQPWKNFSVLVDLAKSIRQVKKIIRDFRPDVGVGVGGYASGAAMWAAANMGIPILLQEQNGFAGVTNKILKNKASKICVAYEGMERFFPADKIVLSGNPIRSDIVPPKPSERQKALNCRRRSTAAGAQQPQALPPHHRRFTRRTNHQRSRCGRDYGSSESGSTCRLANRQDLFREMQGGMGGRRQTGEH